MAVPFPLVNPTLAKYNNLPAIPINAPLGDQLNLLYSLITSGGGNAQGSYTCAAGDVVGDAVYISVADTVAKADNDGANTYPVIGFIISKSAPTTCLVQYIGEAAIFVGLTVGARYYLSDVPGAITTTAPTASGKRVQPMGFAKNTTTLVIQVDQDYEEL